MTQYFKMPYKTQCQTYSLLGGENLSEQAWRFFTPVLSNKGNESLPYPFIYGNYSFRLDRFAMTPLETYLRELRDIRSSGAAVKETSYYPALSNLFNEVGKRLKPRVRCIINLANRGAGTSGRRLIHRRPIPETLRGRTPSRSAARAGRH